MKRAAFIYFLLLISFAAVAQSTTADKNTVSKTTVVTEVKVAAIPVDAVSTAPMPADYHKAIIVGNAVEPSPATVNVNGTATRAYESTGSLVKKEAVEVPNVSTRTNTEPVQPAVEITVPATPR
jgi:hypothetical protein